MEVVFDYPTWFLLLCVLGALAGAGFLYMRDRLNRHFGMALRSLLFIFRAVVFFLLAFFLLKPLIKSFERTVEKPIIVIAQDNSNSLMLHQDSTRMISYRAELDALRNQLTTDFDVRVMTFGEHAREGWEGLDFSEQSTNISDVMDEVYNRYSNRNLGAVIMATDGIFNSGLHPQYAGRKIEAPVYTIALGDTTPRKDVLINDISHNRMAYLGNKFPVEVKIDAYGVNGGQSVLTVNRKGETVYSEPVVFGQDPFTTTVSLLLTAEESGLQRYTVHIGEHEDEVTTVNNTRSIFIDVLDGRQKILILADSPHPDLGALKLAINNNDQYEAETALINDFEGKLADYNLVILHQLPNGSDQSRSALNELQAGKIPTLIVLGGKTNFNRFNEERTGLEIKGFDGTFTEMNTSVHEGFTLFLIDDETRKMVKKFPPLHVPFGDLNFSPGLSTLLQQRAGILDTGDPLMAFNTQSERKVGIIAGEGVWRWRLFNFLESGNHDVFDRLISKTIQFLASHDDKSRFRVDGNSDFLENEEVSFEAEVYNESFELINDVSVQMEITNENGEIYDYAFTASGNRYRLNAGSLPSGNYSYVARTQPGGTVLTDKGEFSVSEIHLENVKTRADHRLLYNLSEASGAAMVMPSNMNTLPELIRSNENLQSVSHETKILQDLINVKWILFVILAFLSVEWLLRKRNGTY